MLTPTGCALVPEPGATGKWTEANSAFMDARPGGSPAGDNLQTGWLFVTPPVRVRLGQGQVNVATTPDTFDTNDQVVVVERPFILEADVLGSSHPTSVGIPVDYTTA